MIQKQQEEKDDEKEEKDDEKEEKHTDNEETDEQKDMRRRRGGKWRDEMHI